MFSRLHVLTIAFVVASFGIASHANAGQLFPPNNLGNPKLNCPNGQLLAWNGGKGTVECNDPTPGVTLACPTGEFLTGISNGKPICEIVTATGAPVTWDGVGQIPVGMYIAAQIGSWWVGELPNVGSVIDANAIHLVSYAVVTSRSLTVDYGRWVFLGTVKDNAGSGTLGGTIIGSFERIE